jgi:hypothetical protein
MESADLNYFIKYGELGSEADVLDVYMVIFDFLLEKYYWNLYMINTRNLNKSNTMK